MTTQETEVLSAAAVVSEDHAQIDAALDAVSAALGGPTRDLLVAYDKVLGLLSRHLFGVEVAVCPVVAHRLRGGGYAVRSHLAGARRMELTMQRMGQILWGDARAPRIALDDLHRQLVEQMASHRDDEQQMLADLEAGLSSAERAAVAERLRHATVHAPTRPHPYAVKRLSWTRLLYRPVGGLDHVRDVLSSRSIPPPRYRERRVRPLSRWGAYVLGAPLPPEGDAVSPSTTQQPSEPRTS